MRAQYLVDVSALARLHHPDVFARVEPMFLAGRLATTTTADLELLSRARRSEDYADIARDRAAVPHAPLGDQGIERAVEIQAALAARGRHRAVGLPELLVAAAADRAGLTVLHYDRAFDLVAEATGQPCEWVVPPRTLG